MKRSRSLSATFIVCLAIHARSAQTSSAYFFDAANKTQFSKSAIFHPQSEPAQKQRRQGSVCFVGDARQLAADFQLDNSASPSHKKRIYWDFSKNKLALVHESQRCTREIGGSPDSDGVCLETQDYFERTEFPSCSSLAGHRWFSERAEYRKTLASRVRVNQNSNRWPVRDVFYYPQIRTFSVRPSEFNVVIEAGHHEWAAFRHMLSISSGLEKEYLAAGITLDKSSCQIRRIDEERMSVACPGMSEVTLSSALLRGEEPTTVSGAHDQIPYELMGSSGPLLAGQMNTLNTLLNSLVPGKEYCVQGDVGKFYDDVKFLQGENLEKSVASSPGKKVIWVVGQQKFSVVQVSRKCIRQVCGEPMHVDDDGCDCLEYAVESRKTLTVASCP